MGDKISAKTTKSNVNGLNQLFSGQALKDLRADVAVLRTRYPNLLDPNSNTRQSALWFAASVLTPNFDLSGYPASTHRRWLMWLMWLKLQQHDSMAHQNILVAINKALTDTTQTEISWTWKEAATFNVTVTQTSATAQTISVQSISGDLSEVEKLAAEANG